MFIRVKARFEALCNPLKQRRNPPGGQGVAGSNPVIPTNFVSLDCNEIAREDRKGARCERPFRFSLLDALSALVAGLLQGHDPAWVSSCVRLGSSLSPPARLESSIFGPESLVNAARRRDRRQEGCPVLPRVMDVAILRPACVGQPLPITTHEILTAIKFGRIRGKFLKIVAVKFDELEMPALFNRDHRLALRVALRPDTAVKVLHRFPRDEVGHLDAGIPARIERHVSTEQS
jgi:hypothetical protein